MKIYQTAALALLLTTSAAFARNCRDQSLGCDMDLAADLGSVLGSEKLCGLSYDQSAIRVFIQKNVSEKDMRFPSLLVTMTKGSEAENESMSKSAVTAHCTQIVRIAKSYGFCSKSLGENWEGGCPK